VYEAVEVRDGVYWVGAIDWDIRDFHGYTTNRGTTYNAYLVKGEKAALVDTECLFVYTSGNSGWRHRNGRIPLRAGARYKRLAAAERF
jgi:hypothetical protein